ncbi:MAG: penicillin-binding protein 1C [Elusimicrobia bacterium]|nr:penicillin-binding protein 1C [Elusimicrobiota bacterium]
MRRNAAAALGLAAASAWVALRLATPEPPAFERVRRSFHGTEAVLLDRRGTPLHELRADSDGRRLDWVELRAVSPALTAAVVLAEDRRFFSHSGVDWLAAASAALRSGASRRPRGASTITMQLASLLDRSLRPPGPGSGLPGPGSGLPGPRRTLRQKARQALQARALERRWTKEQVLEAYLNLATFRGELQGVAAASRGLFGKDAHGLDAVESALLASLLRSPASTPERLAGHAGRLLARGGHGAAPEPVLETARRALRGPYRIEPHAAWAPHAARRLLEERGGGGPERATLASTLDAELQRFAVEALRARLRGLSAQNVRDGALLAVDNATGEVLAYVGNAGAGSSAVHVDGVRAGRQAGSTLKPFLYAAALDRRLLTAATLLDDAPFELPEGPGVFRPANYDERFRGPVSVRGALASSINVPAVRTIQLAGVDSFVETLRAVGIGDLRSASFYGPALALGTADVSLWELVAAYRSLARGGRPGPLRLSPGPAGSGPRAFSSEAAFIVADILADREARAGTFGLESALATRYWTAVKTGTSKDMRDNWCVGFSERYTVGVWVGNFDGSPMWNVSGVTGAAPLWAELMDRLHRRRTSRSPAPPKTLVRRRVEFPTPEAGRDEWFLRGTEPAGALARLDGPVARIVYPTSGAVFAFDPEIPPGAQLIAFESEPAGKGLSWELDGTAVAAAEWAPRPGPHRLALVDAARGVLDAVVFEVR